MQFRYLFFALILTFCTPAQILFSQDRLLNSNELAEAEFTVAMNPMDNSNIILATMHDFYDISDSYLTIYHSNDFGETWEISDFQGKRPGDDGAGDPVLAFDAEGKAYLVNLVVSNYYEVNFILSSSVDGGRTWETEYVYPDPEVDKPWLAIDTHRGSLHKNHKYIPLAAFDGVKMIVLDEQNELVSDEVVPIGDQIPSVVTGLGGDVFVSTITLNDPNEFNAFQYTSRGDSLEHSSFISSTPDYTFDADDISTRFQPSPYLARDNSEGPYAGRLYFAYTGSESDDPTYFNVLLTYSDDDGRSWTTPKIVHTDQNPGVQQYYSSIFVNADGVLLIDWYDRSKHSPATQNTNFFLGISKDGGETFTQLQLNSEPMDFANITDGYHFGVGEYHQVVADKETAISFWSDGRTNDGDLDIYFSKVDISTGMVNVQQHGVVNPNITISQPYPNPVSDEINIDIELEKKMSLSYEITSVDGKMIMHKSENSFNAGAHRLVESVAELSSGSYSVTFRTEGRLVRSMLFLKK